MRVPFKSVNRWCDPFFREGWVRHHVFAMVCMRHPELGPFLLKMREWGFFIDDFVTNGILLPALPSQSKSSGMPLHIGGHPNYNARITSEISGIRIFCESIRADSRRYQVALNMLRASQRRVRKALTDNGFGHVDRVVLTGPGDCKIDVLIDRLLAARDAQANEIRA